MENRTKSGEIIFEERKKNRPYNAEFYRHVEQV